MQIKTSDAQALSATIKDLDKRSRRTLSNEESASLVKETFSTLRKVAKLLAVPASKKTKE